MEDLKYVDMNKQLHESNEAYCRRLAAGIPNESLICKLLLYIAAKDRSRPMWSHIGMATSHGSGVSKAIQDRFLPDYEEYTNK